MNTVIVTVRSSESKNSYDVELPLDLPAQDLIGRITATIKNVDSQFINQKEDIRIKVQHLGRLLQVDETLMEAGVWEGSIIMLVSK